MNPAFGEVGSRVSFDRAGSRLVGVVVLTKRRTWLHIEVADECDGSRVYREHLANCKEEPDHV